MPLAASIMVFTEQPTPRLRYVMDHLLGHLLGLGTIYGHDAAEALAWDGPLLQYGGKALPGALYFPSSAIFFEEGTHASTVEAAHSGAAGGLFPVDGGPWPYDPFASAFFLLTRYEEYLPFTPDALGRFPSTASALLSLGSLDIPWVDRWAFELADLLETCFPGLRCTRPVFSFQPGYDIDVAYAYLGRPWWRSAGAGLRDALRGDGRALRQRMKVLAGLEPDHYDVYGWLDALHERHALVPRWFVQVGPRGERDHNLSPRHPLVSGLIRHLDQDGGVGLHPSYSHGSDLEGLRNERIILEQVTGRVITASRQHYLMLSVPETWNRLVAEGFTEDHTLGFADSPGFRAGTSRPFPWFDLRSGLQRPLTIHPFAVMDGTLKEYLGLGPGKALDRLGRLIGNVRRYGGVFSTLWHNSTLSEQGEWKGWRQVYQRMVEEMINTP
ncbi:MAG TPA: polysaccharide deacetylase family protein [Bacteroidales bacterium]|nr:polysaccharide deacetylase family protein [Bacteroidales bacterium]